MWWDLMCSNIVRHNSSMFYTIEFYSVVSHCMRRPFIAVICNLSLFIFHYQLKNRSIFYIIMNIIIWISDVQDVCVSNTEHWACDKLCTSTAKHILKLCRIQSVVSVRFNSLFIFQRLFRFTPSQKGTIFDLKFKIERWSKLFHFIAWKREEFVASITII